MTPFSPHLLSLVVRGFRKAGQGNPDESRASRYILKDYVSGKLTYVQPPPTWTPSKEEARTGGHETKGEETDDLDTALTAALDPAAIGMAFNQHNYTHIPKTPRKGAMSGLNATDDIDNLAGHSSGKISTKDLDSNFFTAQHAAATMPTVMGRAMAMASSADPTLLQGRLRHYPHQTFMKPDGTIVEGVVVAMGGKKSKKHFKGGKRNRK